MRSRICCKQTECHRFCEIVSLFNCEWDLTFSSHLKHSQDMISERIQAQKCSVLHLDDITFAIKQEQLQILNMSQISEDWMIFIFQYFLIIIMMQWCVKTTCYHHHHSKFFSAFSSKMSTDIRYHEKMRIHHSERSNKSSHLTCLSETILYYYYY